MSSTALAPAASTALAMPPGGDGPRGFLQLTNLAEAIRFAELFCTSDLAPKDYKGKDKVGNAVVAMQMGFDVGLPPLQALQNIAVINGKPGLYGDGMRAVLLSAPDLEDIQETDDGNVATCTIKRRGRSPVTSKFSMEDAAKAGLAGKQGPWSQYPKRMRQWRAFGFAARDAYADRLKGISLVEELQDYPESARTPSEPQRVEKNVTPEGGDRRVTADQGGSTPPASTIPIAAAAPAAPPSNGGGNGAPPIVVGGVKVENVVYIPGANGKATRWEAATSAGTFYIVDEALSKEFDSCAGTDHLFAITFKQVQNTNKSVSRIATMLTLDEEGGGQ